MACKFCDNSMVRVKTIWPENPDWPRNFVEPQVHCCPVCGWWVKKEDHHGEDNAGAYAFTRTFGAVGSLREFDVSKSDAPIKELRNYLAAQFDSRKNLNPKKLENIVASIYRDIGHTNVCVTGQAHDGGVDIVMDGSDDSMVGVQVKRYKNKIEAEEIRSFAGALMLKGFTKGIYVTTSDFTRGARETAGKAEGKGYRIELVNADAFYDALGFAQREIYDNAMDPDAPYNKARMTSIAYKKVWL